MFIGHCDSSHLVEHFKEFRKQINWDLNLLLHFGMDGSSINKTFENKLALHLKKTVKKTLKTWNRSTTYSAKQFQEGSCRTAIRY